MDILFYLVGILFYINTLQNGYGLFSYFLVYLQPSAISVCQHITSSIKLLLTSEPNTMGFYYIVLYGNYIL